MYDHLPMIFNGTAHPILAQEIAEHLGVPLGKSVTRRFPDTEIHVNINEVVRDKNIYLVQPCPPPVNDHLMELILYLDAFRRASARSVTVVIPYFPYARQDRMAQGRESISARVVANLLENQGADRIIFMDIHNQAIQGFFNIPVDPLTAIPVLGDYFKQPEFENAAIVSPDVGRAGLAGLYAEYLHLPLVVIHKRREAATVDVKTTHVVGDIAGRIPIIIDDMVASGSVLKQIGALYDRGAVGKAHFAITHPVLLPSAAQILENDNRIGKLITTNTIPILPECQHEKIHTLSIAPLLADIISNVNLGKSILHLLVQPK